MERIWAQPEFLHSFWGPYMHSIYPKSKVFKKPHLKQIEISLLCLRLAYERVSDRVDTLSMKIQEPYLSHLRNLRIAFDFFIPTVSFVFSQFSLFLSQCSSEQRKGAQTTPASHKAKPCSNPDPKVHIEM